MILLSGLLLFLAVFSRVGFSQRAGLGRGSRNRHVEEHNSSAWLLFRRRNAGGSDKLFSYKGVPVERTHSTRARMPLK
uniref:Secreted protein n=1 Tax=Vespula pensylvanica TaxID=30213 RepID=A0A834NWR5_VESPE|nr:hypothetical protein H0235_010339 [Vespula pensylvanica]